MIYFAPRTLSCEFLSRSSSGEGRRRSSLVVTPSNRSFSRRWYRYVENGSTNPLLLTVPLESRLPAILFPLIFPLVPYLSMPLVNCPDLIVISCRSFHCLLVLPSCSVSDSTELLTIRDQDLFPLYLSIRKNIRTFVYLGRYCDLTC